MKYWIESHPCGASVSGGDFALYTRLRPCRYAVIVGDVAGHGDEASAVAEALCAEVWNLLRRGHSLTELLSMCFQRFEHFMLTDATPLASLFVAVMDDFDGVLRYGSAGHEPGLLFTADGGHRHLGPTGPVFGIPATPVFCERELPHARGDMLVIVTDGITEARRPEGDAQRFFGSSGVVSAVRTAKRSAQDPARAIYQAAIAHNRHRVDDDATALVVLSEH